MTETSHQRTNVHTNANPARLDGSQTAEEVLPYAIGLAGTLKIPIEVTMTHEALNISKTTEGEKMHRVSKPSADEYLTGVAKSFQGVSFSCTVEESTIDNVIIKKHAWMIGRSSP